MFDYACSYPVKSCYEVVCARLVALFKRCYRAQIAVNEVLHDLQSNDYF